MGPPGRNALRKPLTRQRIIEAALRYVDHNGLDALSMHKLGAELGVRGMSLYSHIADKDALLDGIVELMWTEVLPPDPGDGWREAVRGLVRSLRGLAQRHPCAAPLLMSRRAFPEPALRVSEAFLRTLDAGRIPEAWSGVLLRTIMSYGLGFGLAEQSFLPGPSSVDEDEARRYQRVSSLVPPDLDGNLMRVALLLCAECNPADEFELGIDLMILGLESQLARGGQPHGRDEHVSGRDPDLGLDRARAPQ